MKRRRLVGGLAVTGAAAAMANPAQAGTGPVDPHPEWLRRLDTTREAYRGQEAEGDEAELDRLYAECWRIEERLAWTSATTLEGAAAQLTYASRELAEHRLNDEVKTAISTALGTLERIAGQS